MQLRRCSVPLWLGLITTSGCANTTREELGSSTESLVAASRLCGAGHLAHSSAREITPPSSAVPAMVASGFFDGDAHLDLAYARGGTLSVRKGTGTGSFGAATARTVLSGGEFSAIATGDFDHNGTTDFGLVNRLAPSTIHVVATAATGLPTGIIRNIALGTGKSAVDIAAGDIDGDGDADLVTLNTNRTLSLLIQNAGVFTLREQSVGASTGTPTSVIAFDADNDLDADLAVGFSDRNTISLLTGVAGVFAVSSITLPSTLSGVSDLAIADVDGDGGNDIGALNTAGHLAIVGHAMAAGDTCTNGWGASYVVGGVHTLACGSGTCSFKRLVGGDLDADGYDDFVVLAPGGNDVQIVYGSSQGPVQSTALFSTSRDAASATLGDANEDGRFDIFVGTATGAVRALDARCDCEAPYTGPTCRTCTAAACPGVGTPLDEQLTVGPPSVVSKGASIVGASETAVADLRAAASAAQGLAALGHDSTRVVIGHINRVFASSKMRDGDVIPETVTRFTVDAVLVGDTVSTVDVVQEGGTFGGVVLDNSNAVPFQSLAAVGACAAGTSRQTGYYLLFLQPRGTQYVLTPDLDEPHRAVTKRTTDYLLREQGGLAIASGRLGEILRTP
jgi:hypothetical protein